MINKLYKRLYKKKCFECGNIFYCLHNCANKSVRKRLGCWCPDCAKKEIGQGRSLIYPIDKCPRIFADGKQDAIIKLILHIL